MPFRVLGVSFVVALLPLAAGCGGNRPAPRVDVPPFNPGEVASRALAMLDANTDGQIAGAELDSAPGLKFALEQRLDTNGDGKASSEEISARVQQYLDAKVAFLPCRCAVLVDGKPLAGATVRLVPEPFLESVVKPAVGVTDTMGVCFARVEGSDLPGMNPGMYRVEISKTSGGTESIPAGYNAKTTSGVEVASDVATPFDGGYKFELKSRR